MSEHEVTVKEQAISLNSLFCASAEVSNRQLLEQQLYIYVTCDSFTLTAQFD